MASAEAPFGTWRSPVTPERLVEKVVRLGQLRVDHDSIYWVERRPAEDGREVVVGYSPDSGPVDALPGDVSARTRVHEYGGQCYAVRGTLVVFSSWKDQRLWVVNRQGQARPITEEPASPGTLRYADPVITGDGRWVVCVRERHLEDGVVNDLVAVPLVSNSEREPRVICHGHDFFSAPRLSPDGTRLAWLTWDLPDMPWDSTRLWVVDIGPEMECGEPRAVAGGESITQPRWSPSGVLHYVSDRNGWWNLYDEDGRGLCPTDAEFGRPDWVFGASTYDFFDDDRIIAVWESAGRQRLGIVERGKATPISTPYTYFEAIATLDDSVVAIAASPTDAPAVVRIGLDGATSVLRRSQDPFLDPGMVSSPRPVQFPTGNGETAHAFFYPPANPEFCGPEGERPPAVVVLHGGPTSAAMPVFDRGTQFWTTRGFAVIDVNYRGSSGYGRLYRDRLRGAWGIVDVEDCAAAVRHLGDAGSIDPGRAVIRGGSAGGFTALAALAFTDSFAAAASLYGVTDLELLAKDTHKFESRYLDSLVGPWPSAVKEYERRSPIHNVDRIERPLILFQGLEDQVVPPSQSELMYRALLERGVDVEYLTFEGEQHGFRKAETVVTVARAELAFYGRVLGFEPGAC